MALRSKSTSRKHQRNSLLLDPASSRFLFEKLETRQMMSAAVQLSTSDLATRISKFETQVTRQVENNLSHVNSHGFQHLITAEQNHFAAVIAKEGGFYAPIAFSSLVSTATTDKAQQMAELVAKETTAFHSLILKQVLNHPHLWSNAHFQKLIANEQTHFAAVVARQGGTYTPVPFSDLTLGTIPPSLGTSATIPTLSTTAVLANEIDLSWTTIVGANAYVLQQSSDGGTTWTTLTTTPGTTYSVYNLNPNTTYEFTIAAITSTGTGTASTPFSVSTLLLPPTKFAASATSATNVKLTWAAETGATSYKILRATNPNGGASAWTTVAAAATGTTLNDTGASAATTYYYSISSTKSNGTSAPSALVTVTTRTIQPTITGTAVSQSEIDLAWVAVPTAYSYLLETSLNNVKWTTLATLPGLSYQHTGLTANSTHYYRLSAINGSGVSQASAVISKSTFLAMPTGLKARSLSNSSIAVSWIPVTNAVSYKLSREQAGTTTWTTVQPAIAHTSSTYNDTGLLAGTSYTYDLSATNAVGTSANSSTASATTLVTSPTVTGIVNSSTGTVLSWTAVTGATGYKVEASANNGVTWTTLAANQAAVTYSQNGLVPNTTHKYRVSAIGASGTSAPSAVVTLTTFTAAPAGLTAAAVSPTGVHLNWVAVAGATGYQLQRNSSSAVWATLTPTTAFNGSTVSYTDSTALPGTAYDYRLSSIVTGVISGAVASSPVTTYPAAPTVVASNVSSTALNISWGAMTGATGYIVDVSTNAGASWTTKTSNGGQAGLVYAFTGLTPDTAYQFRVTTVGTAGNSPSTVISQTTALPSPTNFGVSVTSATATSLVWTPVADAVTYKLERQVGGAWSTVSSNISSSAVSYNDTGLTAGTTYYYRLSAVNANGSSTTALSTPASVLTLPATTTLTAKAVSSSAITLTWTAVPTATSYVLQTSVDGGVTWNTLTLSSLLALTYTDTNLAADSSHLYSLTAVNGTGSGVAATTPATKTMLAAPAGFAAVVNSATSVTLTWTPNADATSYTITRQVGSGAFATLTTINNGSTGTFADTTIAGTAYSYKIADSNLLGLSNASTAVVAVLTLPVTPTLTATANSISQITLNWNASQSATSYKIEYSTDLGNTWNVLSNQSSTSFVHSGLAADTKYEYRIAAINATGSSPAGGSPTTAYVTASTLLAPPANFTATPATATTVTLAWTAETDATNYKIERETVGTTIWATVNSPGGTVATYTDTVSAGTAYNYRISANDSAGSSVTESVTTLTVPAAPPITATLVSATQINLTWNASIGATAYILESSVGGAPYSNLASQTGLTFSNTGLTPNTTYQYKVFAVDATGPSLASNASNLITTYLAAPTGFATAVSNASAGVVLSWNQSTGATSYRITRSTDDITWAYLTNISSGATVTYTDTAVNPGAGYYYEIAAIDSVGSSAVTPAVSAFTYALTPTGFTETAVSATSVQLSWNASAGAHTYEIDNYTNSNWSQLTLTTITNYTISGLAAGSTNYYRVSAIDAAGVSIPANGSAAVVTPLATPTGFFVGGESNPVEVNVFWNASSGATGYAVQRSLDNVNWSTLAASSALNGSNTTLTDTTVSTGTKYFYRVEALSAGGSSAPTTTASVLTVPAIPTLSGSYFSTTQVQLTWNAVSNASSYLISTVDTNGFTAISNEPVGDVTSDLVTVLPDTHYAFTIQSIDAGGTSNADATAVIFNTPLAAPTFTVGASTSSNAALITFASETDATDYLLRRSTDQTTWTTLNAGNWNSSGTQTYNDTGLAAGTTYYYQLASINSYTEDSPFTTQTALTIPGAPTVTGHVLSATQLNLSWGAVAGATSYTVQVNNSGWTNVTPQPTGTSLSISGLTAGTAYSYQVFAHNATGNGPASPISLTTILPAPIAFSAAPTSATSVTLSFNAASGATSYVLQRSPDGNIWSPITQSLGSSDTTFLDTGLSSGTKYYYRMAVVSASGTSAWSTANVVTLPAAPVLSEVSATYNSINFAWQPIAGATSYTLKEENVDTTWSATANQPTGAVTTFTLPGQTADTTNNFELFANELVNSVAQTSAASNQLAVETALAAPVLSTTTANSSSVTLSFAAIADAVSFVIQRSTDTAVWSTLTNSLGNTSTGFVDTTVSAGTTYTYRIYAVDAAGTSPAATTTITTAPAAPSLTVDVVSDTSLLLSWTASPTATGYTVEAGTTTNGTTTFAATSSQPSGTATSLTLTGLTGDTSYTYEVVATDGSESSPASAPITALTFITAPTFTATANSSTAVSLSFSANADASSYILLRSDDGGAIWNPVTQSPTLGNTSTGYLDTGLTPGTTYEYQLEAANASGPGASISPVSVTTDPDSPVLTGLSASSTEIDLTWNPVLSATGYTLNMNTSNGWVADSQQPVGTNTSIALVNLSTGTTYNFSITALNGSLSSAPSGTLQISTQLGPPTSLTYGAVTDTSVVLNWTAESEATSYVIEQSTDQTTWTQLSPNTPITGTTFTDNTVTPGNTYYYRISGVNTLGVSDPYNALTSVTTPLAAPTGLVATVNSATQITLNWNQDNDFGLTGYRLEYSTTGLANSWTTVASLQPNATSAVDSGLTTATTYYYRLFALSAGGDSAPDVATVVTTD